MNCQRAAGYWLFAWGSVSLVVAELQPDGDSSGSMLFYVGAPVALVCSQLALRVRRRAVLQMDAYDFNYTQLAELKGRLYLQQLRYHASQQFNEEDEETNDDVCDDDVSNSSDHLKLGSTESSSAMNSSVKKHVQSRFVFCLKSDLVHVSQEHQLVNEWYEKAAIRFQQSPFFFSQWAVFHIVHTKNRQLALGHLITAAKLRPRLDVSWVIERLRQVRPR